MGYWYSFNDQMHELFGGKVYRLALSAGCTCPNRDGTLSDKGCIFCSEGGSGDFAEPVAEDIAVQIESAKKRVSSKIGGSDKFAGYMVYFQSFTNTYGDQRRLAAIFENAAVHPDTAALSIATRPDSLTDGMIARLSDINEKKPVFVELGLQTVHESTAEYINRCYRLPVFEEAFKRLKAAGLKVVVHVIIGLPGESRALTEETVRYISELEYTEGNARHIDGIKLQLLHVLKNTRLSELLPYEEDHADITEHTASTAHRADTREQGINHYSFAEISGEAVTEYAGGFTRSEHGIVLRDGMLLPQYTLTEYASFIRRLVSMLPAETAVHRLTGDAPKRLLILPQWTADKKRVLNTITAEFRKTEAKP